MPASIEIADYDLRWPALFEIEAAKIRAALGTSALRVEHAGSTAVPGLAAKPVIDIVLEVANSVDEPAYIPHLESAGYFFKFREPAWHEHRFLKGSNPEVNLHVFSKDCPETARMLAFRDWLRTHPEDRQLYEQTKRALAEKHWNEVQDYADAKSEVVAEIMTRALRSYTVR